MIPFNHPIASVSNLNIVYIDKCLKQYKHGLVWYYELYIYNISVHGCSNDCYSY